MIEAADGGLLGLAYMLAETVKYQVTKRNNKKTNGLDRTGQLREFDRLREAVKEQTAIMGEVRDAINTMASGR